MREDFNFQTRVEVQSKTNKYLSGFGYCMRVMIFLKADKLNFVLIGNSDSKGIVSGKVTGSLTKLRVILENDIHCI